MRRSKGSGREVDARVGALQQDVAFTDVDSACGCVGAGHFQRDGAREARLRIGEPFANGQRSIVGGLPGTAGVGCLDEELVVEAVDDGRVAGIYGHQPAVSVDATVPLASNICGAMAAGACVLAAAVGELVGNTLARVGAALADVDAAKEIGGDEAVYGLPRGPPSVLVAIPPSVPVYMTVGGMGGLAGGAGRCVAGLKTMAWLSQCTFDAVMEAG